MNLVLRNTIAPDTMYILEMYIAIFPRLQCTKTLLDKGVS
jgi:hypothetical protein